VHMLDWPKPDKALIKPELEQGMEIVKKAVEASRFAREEAGIKLRWPLKALSIDGDSKVKKAVETFKEVLLEQANVKSVKFGKSKSTSKEFEFGKIYLDTELTQDILEEALVREVMRAVQVLRKKKGLKVEERISLSIKSDSSVQKTLQKYKKEIVNKVGAKGIEIGTLKGKAKDEFDFKGKKIQIGFDKKGL
jgi:valyl-tRNA synthetase